MSSNSARRKKFKKIFRSTWGYEKLLRPINKTGGYASILAASNRQAKDNGRILKLTVIAVLAGLALIAPGGRSLAQNATQHVAQEYDFDIDEETLGAALEKIVQQTNLVILYPFELADRTGVNPVNGRYSVSEALDILLRGTPYSGGLTESGNMYVSLTGFENQDLEGNMTQGTLKKTLLAGAAAFLYGGAYAAEPVVIDDDNQTVDDSQQQDDKIVVTGTRIKGVKDQFSPVTQLDREDMDLAGFSNVADALEAVPQNFGGGITSDTSFGGPGTGPGGAGVNLRGLGNQATLILLNGRRLATAGASGQFVDISSIPTSAIERVDVLTDGASAIYGSDAIAGVVNIILRDDFNGAESRVNIGTITDGGGDYIKLGQTLGWSGDSAHAMVSYEFSEEKELDSNDKDFASNAIDPTWLLPFSQKHSVFASTGAQLTDRIEISADGYFNDRKSKQFNSRDTGLPVQEFSTVNVQQFGGAVGIDIALSSDWAANFSGSLSKSDYSNNAIGTISSSNETTSTKTEILAFDGSIGGPLFNITGNPVRGVAGAHYRTEGAALLRSTTSSGVIIDSDKSRHVFAAFGEIYAPIISESNGTPGLESLALSAAVRYEDYSDVGSSLDPKVGLSWSLLSGLNLRGTYSKSFRAPRLDQLEDFISFALLSLYVDPLAMSGESIALNIAGGREDLDPEKSRTWTAGFDFSPPSMDGFLLRGTYFNTEFRDQLGAPGITFDSEFRFATFAGIPNRDITPTEALDYCARAPLCFNASDFFPSLGTFTFNDVEVLLDQRQQNLSLSKVAGIDFEGSYEHSSSIGDWRFSLVGTLLTTFENKIAPATPTDDLLNTYGNPVDLKLRGGVDWRRGAISSALYVNHIGDYIDDEASTGDVPISSFTTIDATFRLDLGELRDTPLTEGATLSFTIINLLNEDPPSIGFAPLRSALYDTANSNPVGRKIGFLLIKRW